MNMPLLRRLALATLAGCSALAGTAAHAQSVDRIDPPHWWAAMQAPTVQLLLQGQDLAGLQARVQAGPAGVRVARTIALPNPRYLAVELAIPAGARPGPLTLALQRDGRTVLTQPYTLRARAPGSAQRAGFGPQDAVYLVVPDRFANGDPGNDDHAALGDPANRAEPGGRHGGDLAGMTTALDYIARLGFTQVWPTPLLENRQPRYSYHGYSATDLYRIDPRFGTHADYLRFTAEARARGIGVIQDLVPNHIGSGHPWLTEPPAPDWFNRQGQPYAETNHRHVTVADRYAARADVQAFQDGWFVPTMPDLNQRHPVLARYLIEQAIWWVEEAGLSGIRVDTHPYSDKAFLARWVAAIRAEYPRLTLVGEEMTEHPVLVAYWLQGSPVADAAPEARSPMPAMMDFPLYGVLRQALTEPEGQGYGVGLGRLYEALVNDRLYPAPERMWLFDGNHDTSRVFSALGEDLALNQLLVAYLATAVRTPQFFYGGEVLMTSPLHRDDGIVRSDFPGGWPGDRVNAFTGEGLSAAQREMQATVQRLFTWRRTATAVHRGRFLHFAPDRGTYTYFRRDETTGSTVMVVLSKATEPVTLDTRRFAEVLPAGARGVDVLSGAAVDLGHELVVPPRKAMVIELRR